MSWCKPIKSLSEAAVTWWQWIVVVAATLAFIVPMITPSTEENPTGDAGLYAPVVALSVAAMILTQAVQSGGLRSRPVPGIFIGLGSMASAYLWIADEAGAHPLNPELPLVLLLIFGLVALTTVAIPIFALMSKSK